MRRSYDSSKDLTRTWIDVAFEELYIILGLSTIESKNSRNKERSHENSYASECAL